MPEIILKNVSKRFGKAVAVDNLNLTISDRSFLTLLGPSGCGKTTTLRMIAGLETPTEGEIYIDGRLVFSSEKGVDVSADKRNIGFLFQNYALWPHMTVRKNIIFGLENLKWSKPDIENRLEELLETMHIKEYVNRYPSELSGGQQQRVAIARTLASNPSLLLMDEPLSNLDAKLRLDMRAELKRLHQETSSTFVYVTHDQQEAMSLSTGICLMKDGLLQQFSPPLELYGRPNNMFVADFVGSPSINLIEFDVVSSGSDGIKIRRDGINLNFTPEKKAGQVPSKVVVGIRPEMISIADNTGLDARVESSLPYGMETVLNIDLFDDCPLRAVVFGSIDYQRNAGIKVSFGSNKICLFDSDTNDLIALGSLNQD